MRKSVSVFIVCVLMHSSHAVSSKSFVKCSMCSYSGRGWAGWVPEILVSRLEILPYEHFSPVSGMNSSGPFTSSCIVCCIFRILSIPLICSDTASRVAEAMIGAKVRILCFAYFALFLEFGARTRPQDLSAFHISKSGLKFLI